MPHGFLKWNPTCHHSSHQIDTLIDKVLAEDDWEHPWRITTKVFYLWGHSYEFDNRFIANESDMSENGKNEIKVTQPAIPSSNYLESYITALDACLQGIISPSTLGIDVKKLDNAEAQREKEKTTLYTRNDIIESLQECLPLLINNVLKALDVYNRKSIGADIEVTVNFALDVDDFKYFNLNYHEFVFDHGRYRIEINKDAENVILNEEILL